MPIDKKRFLTINSIKALVITWNVNGRIEEGEGLKQLLADNTYFPGSASDNSKDNTLNVATEKEKEEEGGKEEKVEEEGEEREYGSDGESVSTYAYPSKDQKEENLPSIVSSSSAFGGVDISEHADKRTYCDCAAADLVVVGLQEIVALSTSNVISSTIATQYSLQSDRVELKSIKSDFELIACKNMVGLWLGVYAVSSLRPMISKVQFCAFVIADVSDEADEEVAAVELMSYDRLRNTLSDHKPVKAMLNLKVKR
eukprot:gene27243-35978_t